MPKFYDQDRDFPEIGRPFLDADPVEIEAEASRDKRLTMADAVAIIGVMAILFLPFTIALGVVIAR